MSTSPSSARARAFRLVCVVAATIGVAAAAQTRPNLTGVWLLNYESSDDPRAQVPAGVGEDQRGFGRYGGGGDGFGGGFGGGGLGRSRFPGGGRGTRDDYQRGDGLTPEQVDALRVAIRDQLTAPRRMTIAHEPTEVLFTYDDGRYIRIVPDGREHAGIAGSLQVMRKVVWRDGVLVAEVKFETDQKVIHEIDLRRGGEQLVFTTVLEPRGSQDEVRLRRVYDVSGP